MSLQQGIILAALATLVVLLVRGRRSPAAIFAGVAFFFLLLDFVSVDQALQQVANPGLLTVVVLLLLSVVLDKSRLLETAADALVRGPYRYSLLKLIGATALYSALLNNTAVVASLIGPLRGNRHHAASRLLLPMCYAASLGGVLTLVGTSTNLLINSFMLDRGLPGLHLFDLLPVGTMLLAGCSLFMILAYPLLVRARPAAHESARDYFVEATIARGSTLIGGTVEGKGLRNLGHLFLTEIVRGEQLIAPVEPDEILAEGDILVFAGDVTRLDLLARFNGLQTLGQHDDLPLDNLVEVVVAPESTLARRTLRGIDFRSQFDAAVVAIRRGSERLGGSIGKLRIEVGDTLVLVIGKDFEKRNNLARNFIIVSRRELQKFIDPRKAWLSMAGFVAVIVLSAFGVIGFLKGLLILLAAFLLTGLANVAELRRNMPYSIILIIGSALIISEVMISSGTARLLAGWLLSGADHWGPHAALAMILVITWLLTEMMSNNAAAALAFPVAVGVAEQLSLSPMPFVMAVLYGASCSFSTPYGYQTNLMVMSPGRYALADYARAGFPLAIIYMAICLLALPWVFPFQ